MLAHTHIHTQLEKTKQIGGGHTVVVSEEGRLFTFGAGNEG